MLTQSSQAGTAGGGAAMFALGPAHGVAWMLLGSGAAPPPSEEKNVHRKRLAYPQRLARFPLFRLHARFYPRALFFLALVFMQITTFKMLIQKINH